jgi:hypothetical protein
MRLRRLQDLAAAVDEQLDTKLDKAGGEVEGDVAIAGNLFVSNQLAVDGNLAVDSLINAGTLRTSRAFDGLPVDECSIIDVPGFGSNSGWAGGVLAPNGKIYCFPRHNTSVLVIDPQAGTVDTESIAGLPSTLDKWAGGVLSRNGKIYGMPWSSDSVLIIDPTTNTADITTITGLGSGVQKYAGAVLAPDGKIFGIPRLADNVIIIDPETNTADTATISGLPEPAGGGARYFGGVLAPNGLIYTVPFGADHVLVIDPQNPAVTRTLTDASITTDAGKWGGGALGPDGKIYCIPRNSDKVLVIDPSTAPTETITTIDDVNAATYTYLSADTEKWVGGVLAPSGKIYGIPLDSNCILVIDPVAATATPIEHGFGEIDNAWVGGVLGLDGKIYGVPFGVVSPAFPPGPLVIKTGLPVLPGWMAQAPFNKF